MNHTRSSAGVHDQPGIREINMDVHAKGMRVRSSVGIDPSPGAGSKQYIQIKDPRESRIKIKK